MTFTPLASKEMTTYTISVVYVLGRRGREYCQFYPYLLLVEKPNGLAIASNLSMLNATRTKVEP